MSESCGEFAASFIPRLGTWFTCVLPKGHEGEHRAGGTCVMHGPYAMEAFGLPPQCPYWSTCGGSGESGLTIGQQCVGRNQHEL
jgi:hypothetical protein